MGGPRRGGLAAAACRSNCSEDHVPPCHLCTNNVVSCHFLHLNTVMVVWHACERLVVVVVEVGMGDALQV